MASGPVHIQVREEDGAFWATVAEYPGVLATGDDLEELRASLEAGICLMEAAPGGEVPDLRLSPFELEPGDAPAGAVLVAA